MKLWDIISWDDKEASVNDVVVYRHEAEDFNTHTQVIVQENQEALFYHEGAFAGKLGPGRHTLKTANLPILGKIMNFATRGETPFKCKVVFVNKVRMTGLRWGTPNPIQCRLKVGEDLVFLHLRANGVFGISVDESEKLVKRISGTQALVAKDEIAVKLRDDLVIKNVTTLLGDAIGTNNYDIFNLASYYTKLSDVITEQMQGQFEEYGIKLELFSFNMISVPDEDLAGLKEIQETTMRARAAAAQTDILSEAEARKRAREGYTYQQEKGMEVMKAAASNEGMASNFMGAGMGLGMGVGMGSAFGQGMSNVAQTAMSGMQEQAQAKTETCPECGAAIPAGAKFCNGCGKKLGNFCPDCGAAIPAGAKFCGECGKKLTVACPNCGIELASGAKFCSECGTKI